MMREDASVDCNLRSFLNLTLSDFNTTKTLYYSKHFIALLFQMSSWIANTNTVSYYVCKSKVTESTFPLPHNKQLLLM